MVRWMRRRTGKLLHEDETRDFQGLEIMEKAVAA
jgi:hypothetical protein